MLFSISCTAYVAAPRKTSQLSRRTTNGPRMVSSWYDSGLRLDGSVAEIRMSADGSESLDGSAAALDALGVLEARLDSVADAVAPEAETNFYSFLNAEMNAATAAQGLAADAPAAPAETLRFGTLLRASVLCEADSPMSRR